MKKTVFCDNYFPPTVIVCKKYSSEEYEDETDYRSPNDGVYPDFVYGVWNVKYKKLDPNYYCKGQLKN